MRRTTTVMLVAGLGVAAAASYKFVQIREDLKQQQADIAERWSRVEAALDRRAEAIPPLLDAVKKKPESDAVFTGLASARAALNVAHGPQEKIRANREISLAIAR